MSGWGIHTGLGACLLRLFPRGVFGKKLCYLGMGFHTSEMSGQDQEMADILWFSMVISPAL